MAAVASPVNFDEIVIRPSPQKPFETAESPSREPLIACDFCGRNFNKTNLSRHVSICQRLAQKPKREAFATIAQRLSHVAQEDAVKPIMRELLSRKPEEVDDAPLQRPHKKATEAVRRKKSPTRGGVRTGADLFKEQQKGHSRCQYCERSFKEEVHERHVTFCKTQFIAKQRKAATVKEDPNFNLLMKRVKYRPPLPRAGSKNSVKKPEKPRKAISAFSSEQKAPAPNRPNDLKVLGSQSAMARVNSQPKSKTPTGEIIKLTGKVQDMLLSESPASHPTAPRQRIITPYQDSRTSPSDYGSGESLFSRTGSLRVKNYERPMGNSKTMSSLVDHEGSGDGSSVESVMSKSGASRVKASTVTPVKASNGSMLKDAHKIYHSSDLLTRTGSMRAKNPNSSPGITTTLSRTLKASENGIEEVIRRVESKAGTNFSATMKSTSTVTPTEKSYTSTTPHHERPYPFNVHSAQKEHMMQLHRSNSLRAKKSADSLDWDSFLKPAVLNHSETFEPDKFRLFHWDGEKYRAPPERSPTKLSDFTKTSNGSPGSSAYSSMSRWKPSTHSHAESLEEFTDTTSESISPLSPMGSTSSVSVKSSYMSSVSSLSQDKRTVVANPKVMSSPSAPKFCHNCGHEFPISTASFCCHCGIARLTINRGHAHVK
ncbi:hypothetical protein RvY_13811 [Ramazzottius varieornatus]|uniref:C2HC/C3H-type domain-containing protein n=1 Tax=Ramazzottius varieornatus TaxID=947166 RepID=A0A1D1VP65_RAMVA|nr:hypothetical protein RvY_13811 [Ramazzottius varieornatus]